LSCREGCAEESMLARDDHASIPEVLQQPDDPWTHAIVTKDGQGAPLVDQIVSLREIKVDMIEGVATPESELGLQFGLEACHACPVTWKEAMQVIMELDGCHEATIDHC